MTAPNFTDWLRERMNTGISPKPTHAPVPNPAFERVPASTTSTRVRGVRTTANRSDTGDAVAGELEVDP